MKTLQCKKCNKIDEIKDVPKLSDMQDQTDFEVRFDKEYNIYWLCDECALIEPNKY